MKTLGIDIGSISVSVALLNEKKIVEQFSYAVHRGRIKECLRDMLNAYDPEGIHGYAVTSSAPLIFTNVHRYDARICFIAAVRLLNRNPGSLLVIGGEKFSLILFDEKGEYRNCRSNSSCAAGTGSFLDQQALRLNLSGIEEFSRIALRHLEESGVSNIPKIASRCAVFAKTDLIHAQQEGYTPGEIADGLSFGLSKNIVDALFSSLSPHSPLICCGGVSKNPAVLRHIADLIGLKISVDEYSQVYGAVGAAICLIDEKKLSAEIKAVPGHAIFLEVKKQKKYHSRPLVLEMSEYPDFTGLESYAFSSEKFKNIPPVEVDIYESLQSGMNHTVILGMDIGSTSTKVVILGENKNVIAGFYTRTSGRPVEAAQVIFESIDDLCARKKITVNIRAAGTTGSGRKFISQIAGADLVLDEISAHARAAYELDPGTDTIIEIGGQDSKFTTMKNGMVTFSVMNNVCAAGTGSFIEEQAEKLGVPLSDFAARTEGVAAPLSSDRCTVFMERDINNNLNEGYSVNEILSSVLHSVRENYLMKVAVQNAIGEKIFFQGATAKNRSLVAAFEQKLGKPIMVSKYCHLTGALGVALVLHDEGANATKFRGIQIYRKEIPVQMEICELCANHCKIKIAEVGGEFAAFGFLCGRDYDTKKYVNADKSNFDLIRARKKAFDFRNTGTADEKFSIGIPSSLYLIEELPLWKKFFDLLNIKTITSEEYTQGHQDGKNLTGAEFCSPITDLHGHVQYLLGKADYIFLPVYLETKRKENEVRRQYCYYTQYAPSMITSIRELDSRRILTPLVRHAQGNPYNKIQLYKMLKSLMKGRINPMRFSSAYEKAEKFYASANRRVLQIFDHEFDPTHDISVVLLGRPYTILTNSMNKGIPQLFARLGIKTFFQDMIPHDSGAVAEIKPLLNALHWKYSVIIAEKTAITARKEGLYPVLVTSFKCAPDSIMIDYFKQIMESHEKPYLILQLDEHDSTVGYETRIEAAIRSFRNHFSTKKRKEARDPFSSFSDVYLKKKKGLAGKTVLFPRWDSIACRLMASNMQFEGYDARILDETDDSVRKSMALNSGQCIPLSIIAGETIDYVEKHGLDPKKTALWVPEAKVACNIRMFPFYIKKIFESHGSSMENMTVYAGDLTFTDISLRAAINVYFVYMFSGLVRKIGCKLRPYENIPGETDRAVRTAVDILDDAFRNNWQKDVIADVIIGIFEKIEITKTNRPRVVIFGDLYARDNEIFNQHLVKTIEENGGEVVTTPYSDIIKAMANAYMKKWFLEGNYINVATAKIFYPTIKAMEKKFLKKFNRILKEPEFNFNFNPEKVLARFNALVSQGGESMENLLKIHYITEKYPDISLFVQTNPAFCCPSLVTEAMADRIEQVTGVPVVTVEYDGTGGFKNGDIIPYLKFPRGV